MPREEPYQKIGAGHAAGMFRQGLKELRAAVYSEGNIAQQPDLGIVGNATPGEIAQSREAEAPQWEEEKHSALDDRVQPAASRDDPGKDDRDKGIDREYVICT